MTGLCITFLCIIGVHATGIYAGTFCATRLSVNRRRRWPGGVPRCRVLRFMQLVRRRLSRGPTMGELRGCLVKCPGQ